MIEVNLMPDVKQELLRAQRVRTAVVSVSIFVGIAATAVVVLLCVWVFAVQAVRSGELDKSIDTQSKEYAAVEDLAEVLTIQNQLSLISNINAEKNIQSRLFDVLYATTPTGDNEVSISRLVLDSSEGIDRVTIEAQSTGGYAAAELHKKVLESAVVSYTEGDSTERVEVPLAANVSLGETSYGEDQDGSMTLRFTISFEYAPEIMKSTINDVRITISQAGNVTDSYIGVPRSLFADPATDIEEGQEDEAASALGGEE